MRFWERFQKAAEHAKVAWSPTVIGAALGLRKQTVARWMDEAADGDPSGANVFLIADRWKVDARWLATGEGEMLPRVPITTARQPGATYAAVSEAALEVAREFDELNEPAREHLQQQMKFLRAAQGVAMRPGAAMQYETSRVRKSTPGSGIGPKGKKAAVKKT